MTPLRIEKPPLGEIVTNDILSNHGLDLFSFVNTDNPSWAWRTMVNDHRLAMDFYRDIELKDPTLSAALENRREAVLSKSWKILEPEIEGKRRREQITRFVRDVIKEITIYKDEATVGGFENVAEALLDANARGFAVLEILWKRIDGALIPAVIKPRPQRIFAFNRILKPQTGRLRLLKSLADLEGIELPPRKFIVASFKPYFGWRTGTPLILRAFWPHWFGKQDLRFWVKFIERGNGVNVTKYRSGATPEEKNAALEAAKALNEETAVAVPAEFVIDTLEKARAGSTPDYEALAEFCERAKQYIVLGQVLTMRGSDKGSGSRALGEVHERVEATKIENDSKLLMAVVNSQLIAWTVQLNFGPDAPRPIYSIEYEPVEDLKSRLDREEKLFKMGLSFPESYVRSTYGIPEPKEGEAVISTLSSPQFGEKKTLKSRVFTAG